jgi:hypothetical protein
LKILASFYKNFSQDDLVDNKFTFDRPQAYFAIKNDGTADLEFTIGTNTVPVYAGERWAQRVPIFSTVTVSGNQPFRAYGGLY